MSTTNRRNITKMETTYVVQKEAAGIAAARRRKRILRRLTLFMIFALFTASFMISSIHSQSVALDAKVKQKKQLDQQLGQLKEQQANLKDDIKKLNDDDYIAKLARKNFFMSNPNEIIFHLPESKKENSTTK